MKLLFVSSIFLAMIIATVIADEPSIGNRDFSVTNPPLINRPKPIQRPSSLGGGNLRWRRSPEPQPQGSIVLQGQKPLSGPERRPTWNLDYQHNIWQGKDGRISASGGALKLPGQRVQPQVGIQGQWRFR
ncbi:uncharacterized protein LOC122851155 [Aphidius gifuensis]|uniref:uncharacterized protein LOC122851155 n=1 Tax=Aphidius gifuensis TaxID=684658 RepID=UPI001CDB573B|nr:uncharacterized protein LOC122851155 [Aphidius gifuensis]